jgi:hypothetical protein
MKIETKYNINQEVWFMYNNKPRKDKPFKIDFSYDSEKAKEEIIYTFKKTEDRQYILDDVVNEKDIFATKEELINSL